MVRFFVHRILFFVIACFYSGGGFLPRNLSSEGNNRKGKNGRCRPDDENRLDNGNRDTMATGIQKVAGWCRVPCEMGSRVKNQVI
jgi:hypothetical protein